MIELEATTSTPPAAKGSDFFRVVAPILVLGLGVFVLWGSIKLRRQPTVVADEKRLPVVNVAPATLLTDGFSLVESGSVVPFRELTLAAEVAGRIVEKAEVCRAGRFVQAGTLLLTIDPRDYQIEVRRLKQEVRQEEVSLREAAVELSNVRSLIALAEEDRGLQRREVARLESLVTGRAAAASELDRARSTEILARNTLQTLKNQATLIETRQESLKAALELSKTKLEKASIDLERTEIRAPCDGVITSEMVEADSFVNRGMTLVKLEDTSAVEVRCNLRSDYLDWLWAARNRIRWQANDADTPHSPYEIPRVPATVSLSSGDELFEWDGVLSRYEGFGLDEETRTIPCRVLVEEPTKGRMVGQPNESAPALVRGMFVDVSIHVVPDQVLLTIPARALRLGEIVWVVRDRKLIRQPVDLVMRQGERVIVEASENLQPNDNVVVSPLASAIDGMQVKVESE